MKENRKASISATQPKRRWLNIGPGLVLALAISAFIGVRYVRTEIASRQQQSAPPIVERQVVSSSYEEKLGPTPQVSFIIDRAEKLHVTAAQLARLKALQEEWQTDYGPKIAKADRAAARTNEYLADAKDNSRTPVAQIQNAAAPVVALSRKISAARRSYWTRATKILDPAQRNTVQAARETAWADKVNAMSSTTHK